MNKDFIQNRNKIVKQFFSNHNININFLGQKENPLILDITNGEILNCSFSNDGSKLIFGFNEINRKKFYVKLENLNKNSDFDFNYWYRTSTKKLIYIFHNDNRIFHRYAIINNMVIPIFTETLDKAYFVFKLQKALVFQRQMSKYGITLKIKREWESQKKTYL